MARRLAAFVSVLGLAMWIQFAPAAAQQPARLGFVVGNAEYGQSPLSTALNDAGLVAEALRSVGFEIVEAANISQVDFVRSLRVFLAKAEASGPDAVLFVYLSGYAFAFEGDNYFVAIDAKLDRESDIPLDTMRLSDVIRALEGAPARTKIVAIDAARRLPFPLAAAGLSPGLVAVEAPQNMLISFPTGPGLTVAEGKGPYGPYATAIAEMVRAAGLDIAAAYTRIRARTHQLTEGQQTPWHVSALGDAVVLVPAEAAAVAPAPVMPSAARERRPFREVSAEQAYAVAIERDELPIYIEFVEAYPRHPYAARIWAIIRARREALAWKRAIEINSPQSYWTYLRRYPNGSYAPDAERQLRRLAAPIEAPSDFVPIEFADVPPPVPEELVASIDYAPPAPPPPLILIEPGPSYFVDLPPPPPPVTRGGLPAVTVLPAIPRLAPGVRVPFAARAASHGGGQPGEPAGRRQAPQGGAGATLGAPVAAPQADTLPQPAMATAPSPAGGPPAPGSTPTGAHPGMPAPSHGSGGMRPPRPSVAAVPASGQAQPTPPTSAPGPETAPPASRTAPARVAPVSRPSGPGAPAPAASLPSAPKVPPQRARRQGGQTGSTSTPQPGQVALPPGTVADPDAPRPPGIVPQPSPSASPSGAAGQPQPSAPPAAVRPSRPPPPAATRPPSSPEPAAAMRPTQTPPGAAARPSPPQAAGEPAADRREGSPPGSARAAGRPPSKREGKTCTIENGVEVCR